MSKKATERRETVKLSNNGVGDNESPKNRPNQNNNSEIPLDVTHASHSKVPILHRNDLQIKMLMIGNVSVGKTNVMMRFAKGRFSPQYSQTIGLDFQLKTTKIEEKKIQIQIWDTSGQERFRSLTQNYYRGTNAVILVFDITNRTSFDALNGWLDEIQQNTASETEIVVVGNKSDLNSQRTVSYEEAANFARSLGMKYYEASAKDNINIDELFVGTAMDVYFTYFPDALIKRKDTIEIVGPEGAPTKKKKKVKNNDCC
eukprot:gene15327-17142_t